MIAQLFIVVPLKKGSSVEVIMKDEIDIDDDDINRFLDANVSPASPKLKRKDGLIGILTTTLSNDDLLTLFNRTLHRDVTMRRTIVEYYGSDISFNDLTAEKAMEITGALDLDGEADYTELLELLGLYRKGIEYMTIFSGHKIIVEPAFGMIVTKFEDDTIPHSQMTVIQLNKKAVVFSMGRRGSKVSEEVGNARIEIDPMKDSRISIPVRPIFTIVGKIDLSAFVQPSKLTDAWLDRMCSMLVINGSKLSQDQKLDKIYETINAIAGQMKNIEGPYFLLTEEYVQRTGLTINKKIDTEMAIAIMARKHGNVVVSGSPLFDESTLKDGAQWYLAKLAKK